MQRQSDGSITVMPGYLDVPNVVFWKQECLLQEYLPKLDRYIVLSDYDTAITKNFWILIQKLKLIPEAS